MTAVTKAQVWDWLKAERQWKDRVRQWLNREQYAHDPLQWQQRCLGKPRPPFRVNRAYRRSITRQLKQVK